MKWTLQRGGGSMVEHGGGSMGTGEFCYNGAAPSGSRGVINWAVGNLNI